MASQKQTHGRSNLLYTYKEVLDIPSFWDDIQSLCRTHERGVVERYIKTGDTFEDISLDMGYSSSTYARELFHRALKKVMKKHDLQPRKRLLQS